MAVERKQFEAQIAEVEVAEVTPLVTEDVQVPDLADAAGRISPYGAARRAIIEAEFDPVAARELLIAWATADGRLYDALMDRRLDERANYFVQAAFRFWKQGMEDEAETIVHEVWNQAHAPVSLQEGQQPGQQRIPQNASRMEDDGIFVKLKLQLSRTKDDSVLYGDATYDQLGAAHDYAGIQVRGEHRIRAFLKATQRAFDAKGVRGGSVRDVLTAGEAMRLYVRASQKFKIAPTLPM